MSNEEFEKLFNGLSCEQTIDTNLQAIEAFNNSSFGMINAANYEEYRRKINMMIMQRFEEEEKAYQQKERINNIIDKYGLV